jgi:hypothetical protein
MRFWRLRAVAKSLIALGALVAYVASLGPVLWLCDHGLLPGSTPVERSLPRQSLDVPEYIAVTFGQIQILGLAPEPVPTTYRSYLSLWIVPPKRGC